MIVLIPASTSTDSKMSVWASISLMVVCTYAVWGRVLPPFGQLPGDVGDTRFNMYALENTFQWTIGNSSLWNMPMFWPLQGTSAFSDVHLGSIVFYSVPRLLGLERYEAMQVWFAFGLFLTLFSAYFAARWMKCSAAAGALIAIVFTCALPITAQAGHAQLVHRWAAPWAIAAVFGMSRSVNTKRSYLCVFVTSACVQFLLSPGTAVATLYVSFLVWLMFAISGSSVDDYREIRPNFALKVMLVLGSIVVMATLYVATRYSYFQNMYDISRDRLEVWQYSPTFKSLFMADHSRMWYRLSYQFIIDDSGRHETQLFVGLALSVLFFIGMFGLRSLKDIRVPIFLGSVLVFVGIIRLGDSSIFIFLANIPGFDSVRTPGRFMLILLFPISLIAAYGFDALIASGNKLFKISAIILFVFLVLEYSNIDLMRISKSDLSAPTEQMIERVSEKINPSNRNQFDAFFVFDDAEHNPFMLDLDAISASQILHVPTLNGYSGFIPFGYENVMTCGDLDEMFADILKLKPKANLSRIALIGGECG